MMIKQLKNSYKNDKVDKKRLKIRKIEGASQLFGSLEVFIESTGRGQKKYNSR